MTFFQWRKVSVIRRRYENFDEELPLPRQNELALVHELFYRQANVPHDPAKQ